ncbi:MAG: ROK family protein [Acidobacteria bacterium]|nr:ROK family protein [Acidobacteriota bacterium]
MSNVIAVDIGGTRFRVGLFDEGGKRVRVSEDATNRSGGRPWMLAQMEREFRTFQAESGEPIRACGISFGGPVDFAGQQVTSIVAPGWENFPLSSWVKETLGVPCLLDNDANAGALGEYRFGTGRGCESIFYVALSTGIGGGFVCEGKVIRGKDTLAGELGHLPMADSGPRCDCGARGCLEAFSSGSAIGKMAREWGERRTDVMPRMVELSGGAVERVTAREVALAAAEGDPIASRIFRDAARWLGRGLLTVIRIVNPDKIVLGGGVSQAGKLLLDPIHDVLDERKSAALPATTEIVIAELGNYSALYGAVALALDAR